MNEVEKGRLAAVAAQLDAANEQKVAAAVDSFRSRPTAGSIALLRRLSNTLDLSEFRRLSADQAEILLVLSNIGGSAVMAAYCRKAAEEGFPASDDERG